MSLMLLRKRITVSNSFSQWQIPISEGGAPSEKDSFGFGLGLIKQPEKWMVFHTNLPKYFTLVSTSHHKLQCVLMGALKSKFQEWSHGVRCKTETWTNNNGNIEHFNQQIHYSHLLNITYVNFWVELDKEPFSLEAQLSHFRPIKSIYFCVALWGGMNFKTN